MKRSLGCTVILTKINGANFNLFKDYIHKNIYTHKYTGAYAEGISLKT